MEPEIISNLSEVDSATLDLIHEVMTECFEVTPLKSISIKFLFCHKPRYSKSRAIFGTAKAFTAKDELFHEYKGVVIFDKTFWDECIEGRKPLILHELCHFLIDDVTGSLSIIDHDITEFYAVYRRYGDWQNQIAHVNKIQSQTDENNG